jgi:hypothetical protein
MNGLRSGSRPGEQAFTDARGKAPSPAVGRSNALASILPFS